MDKRITKTMRNKMLRDLEQWIPLQLECEEGQEIPTALPCINGSPVTIESARLLNDADLEDVWEEVRNLFTL